MGKVADVERIREAYERRGASVDATRYALDRPGNRLALQERSRLLLAHLAARRVELAALDILEIGCGSGGELAILTSLGAVPGRLHGIDIREEALAAARDRIPGASLVAGDASALPWPDHSFDLVYQATALSSMLSREMRDRVAAEMRRVTRPGGVIVSYDFAWNPRNRDTLGITLAELRRLFPGLAMEAHRVTLAPPLARWIGDRSRWLLRMAAAMPFLRTHRLAFIDLPRR
jgi:SAM-dependent methyltransferase